MDKALLLHTFKEKRGHLDVSKSNVDDQKFVKHLHLQDSALMRSLPRSKLNFLTPEQYKLLEGIDFEWKAKDTNPEDVDGPPYVAPTMCISEDEPLCRVASAKNSRLFLKL
jgi:hypothetical protein